MKKIFPETFTIIFRKDWARSPSNRKKEKEATGCRRRRRRDGDGEKWEREGYRKTKKSTTIINRLIRLGLE